MLMDHSSQVTTGCREDGSQCRFEDLLPVQMAVVVKELVTPDTEMKKALANGPTPCCQNSDRPHRL